jgi:hypothetical protein
MSGTDPMKVVPKVVEDRTRRHHILVKSPKKAASVRLGWQESAAPEAGRGSAMSQPDALQQATIRLDVALDELESFLRQVFAEGEGASVAALKEQVRFLTDERDRLLLDLDAERNRVRRLKAANDEVSGRLEAVMVTLKELMPAVPG